ncbi:MAG: cytochrome P450 [Henriciella sp.]|uniref:cytochrome P450 n=1 Tax=Henriciella sp. TaxID=1968823 RepID=UPI000C10EDD8|nr:cytochrome P450 [Henriciella sp.]MAN73811.1 cytochrome P450 [Henriciella sp.]PHR82410.1 MAG: cytochrome P450 [Henriciella sp.]|tara:strand:+ start:34588 stop:35922 length:1335 start_codon:yes stop_codon:yes gene_type:complete
MSDAAIAQPPETKKDPSRQMSEAARATSDLIVNPEVYAHMDQLDAAFARLRAEDPVAWCEPEAFRPFWAVTKHADIMEVSRQNKLFTNGEREMLSYESAEERVYAQTGGPHLLKTLVQLDDPMHYKLRHLTQDWFMPHKVKTREDAIRTIAKEFVDRMEDMGGECDFQQDIALYYPLRIIMQILGVPVDDEPMMLKLTQEIFGAQDPDLMRDKELAGGGDADKGLSSIQETLAQFFMYFTNITQDRRENPKDDVSTVIANGTVDGEPIGQLEAMSYYIIVAAAGHDTTSASTGGGVLGMLNNPAQLKKMMDDPKGMSRTAVDEAIRWTTPVKHFMRTAQDDYELRGRKILKGESLLLCYPSGNRDEEVFDDPFEFRVDRSPNKIISFGHGGHMCLGMHLARLEMQAIYEELFSRVKSIELAGDPTFIRANFVGGPKSIPVRYKF